jgi:1,4-dihydroxy-6-naphthoate synthase
MLATKVLRFGHSPDPDDAFMFYGFAEKAVMVRDFEVEHVLEDIQSLNQRARKAELEITAVSAHAYAYLADQYWVMRTGASMGRGYGPLVVSREPLEMGELEGKTVALPGEWTSAALAFGIFAPQCRKVQRAFDEILEEVAEGKVDAGVLIHEGQLTFADHGVQKVADLGELWRQRTDLPLPLGLDVVRADLGPTLAEEASHALRKSIEYAFQHEEDALTYALDYGRGLERELGRKFIKMYVNDDTIDLGSEGEEAIRTLYRLGAEKGLLEKQPDLHIVG